MARRDGSSGGEEEVLSPEELDLAADEHVANLGSGRYVVGSDGPPNEDKVEEVRAELAGAVEMDADAQSGDSGAEAGTGSARPNQSTGSSVRDETVDLDGHTVKSWIDSQLAASDSRYAYRIAAKSGDRVSHQQLASDDIGMAFDALLMWYAQQVGRGTAVEQVLGILLAESSIRVRYPTQRLLAYLDENDLGPNDSISELISEVQDDGGLVFPPSER